MFCEIFCHFIGIKIFSMVHTLNPNVVYIRQLCMHLIWLLHIYNTIFKNERGNKKYRFDSHGLNQVILRSISLEKITRETSLNTYRTYGKNINFSTWMHAVIINWYFLCHVSVVWSCIFYNHSLNFFFYFVINIAKNGI